jgi:CRP-like cAMP-binding protein
VYEHRKEFQRTMRTLGSNPSGQGTGPARPLALPTEVATTETRLVDGRVAELRGTCCEVCPWRLMPAFETHGPAELAFLRKLKTAHGFARAGTELIRVGTAAGALRTLFSGWAIRSAWFDDGSRQIFEVLLPGDLFGIEALLGETAWYATQAITDVSYCVFDTELQSELFDHHPELARKLARHLGHRLRAQDGQLAKNGRRTADARLAGFLVDLHHRLVRRGMAGEQSFPFPLTQQQLADVLGLTIVHVNRVLKHLRNAGLVVVSNRQVVIHDAARLVQLAGPTLRETLPFPLL